MLQLQETRVIRTLPEDVAPGVSIPEEGIPLTYVKVNSKQYVRPAVNGDLFAGISWSRNAPPAALPRVEAITYAAAGGALTRAPIAGQVLVTDAVTGVAMDVVTTGNPTNAQILIDAQGNWALHADNADKSYNVQFHYAPSYTEAVSVIGDAPIGGLPSEALGQIGAAKQGQFSTNFYDASVDWSDVTYVTVDNGLFTAGNAGDHIPGAVVKNAPSADNAFLIVSINVA